jgi:hypothetical protein
VLKVVKVRKKKYKNNIDRVQAVRTTKAKYQAKYRLRKREEKIKEQQKFTNKTYQTDIYNSIKHLDFEYQATLRFNNYTSIEFATAALQYLTKRLDKGVLNHVATLEHGADNNIHIHLALQFSKEFLSLYATRKRLKQYLYSIWNNETIKNGAVWIRRFRTIQHKENYLQYMFKQVLPVSKFHHKQKQVDHYYIQSFRNIAKEFDTSVNELTTILNKANISPKNDYKKITIKSQRDENIMLYRPLKTILNKYKQQAISLAIAAVWLLLV